MRVSVSVSESVSERVSSRGWKPARSQGSPARDGRQREAAQPEDEHAGHHLAEAECAAEQQAHHGTVAISAGHRGRTQRSRGDAQWPRPRCHDFVHYGVWSDVRACTYVKMLRTSADGIVPFERVSMAVEPVGSSRAAATTLGRHLLPKTVFLHHYYSRFT